MATQIDLFVKVMGNGPNGVTNPKKVSISNEMGWPHLFSAFQTAFGKESQPTKLSIQYVDGECEELGLNGKGAIRTIKGLHLTDPGSVLSVEFKNEARAVAPPAPTPPASKRRRLDPVTVDLENARVSQQALVTTTSVRFKRMVTIELWRNSGVQWDWLKTPGVEVDLTKKVGGTHIGTHNAKAELLNLMFGSTQQQGLQNISSMNLNNNLLTLVPDSIGNLTALTVLNLSDNQLTSIPDSIGNLTALAKLYLGKNQLTSIPDSIGNLIALTGLNLNKNKLTSISDSIGNLTALTALNLNNNQLTSIPDSIGKLTALTKLELTNNQLTSIPDSIGNLTALTTLNLSENQRLTSLPDSIGNLIALTMLGLSKNQLTSLPESIGNLTALTKLNLDNNQLTTIPDSIGNLTALTGLGLVSNRVAAIPTSVASLNIRSLRFNPQN